MIGSSGKPRLVYIVNRPVISRQGITKVAVKVWKGTAEEEGLEASSENRGCGRVDVTGWRRLFQTCANRGNREDVYISGF